jgi:valyl-tRNA synthetase
METIMAIVRAIRNARADYDVKPGHVIPARFSAGDREGLLRDQAEVLCALARLDPAQFTVAAHLDAPAQALTLVAGNVSTFLPLSGLVDLGAERQKLARELAETEAQIERSRTLLAGPFAQRAPAAVVQREQDKMAELLERAASLRKRLAELG